MQDQSVDTKEGGTRLDDEVRGPASFSEQELRRIFKRLLDDEVADARLPYRRRRKLMRYAAQIGIDAFQASLMIAQAEREAGHHEDPDLHQADDLATLLHPERWPIWFKLSAAMVIAMLVDIVVIRSLGW